MALNGAAVPRDPGLQPERTGLAWSRTGLALAANALLALRAGVAREQPAATIIGVVLLVAAAFVVGFGFARKRELVRGEVVAVPAAALVAIVVMACTACLAALTPLLAAFH